jgi:hypothetical protein
MRGSKQWRETLINTSQKEHEDDDTTEGSATDSRGLS